METQTETRGTDGGGLSAADALWERGSRERSAGLHGEGGVRPGSEACAVSADVCPMGLGALAGPRTERQADLQQVWACGPGPKSSVSAWTGLRVPPAASLEWRLPRGTAQGPAAQGCGEAGD